MSFYSYTNQTYNILKKRTGLFCFFVQYKPVLSTKQFFREQLFSDSK